MSGRASWRRHFGVAVRDLEKAQGPARPWPTTVLFRMRYEILAAAWAAFDAVGLPRLLGVALASSIIWVLIGIVLSVPPVRAAAVSLGWHVVTPHRVRRCCVELGIYGRNGRLPVIVRTRTTGDGQRMTIWCRAGTTAQEFRDAVPYLRTACWAEEVHVEEHPRGEPFLILVVDRRPGVPFSQDGTGDAPGGKDALDDGRAARLAVPAQRASGRTAPAATTI